MGKVGSKGRGALLSQFAMVLSVEKHRANNRRWYARNKERTCARRAAVRLQMTPEQKETGSLKTKEIRRQARLDPEKTRFDTQTMLYIMTIDQMPGFYKVGRTSSVANRRRQLNAGYCFNVRIVAEYFDSGRFELVIHDLLSPYRVKSEGSGCREWYKTTVEHIHNTIQSVINSNSASSSSIPAGVPSTNLNHPEESDEEDA